jgi:hypothetical protein
LSEHAWQVTAVDFSASALAHGRSMAEAVGADVSERIVWVEGDPTTGAATAAAGQVQVSVESAVAALDPRRCELVVAEERPRPIAGTGVDAVIRGRKHGAT